MEALREEEMKSAEKDLKNQERDFWEDASCGEKMYLDAPTRDGYLKQSRTRYELEPEILTFASFDKYSGGRVLEIGLGLGADHQKWAEAGTILYGVDLTRRAVEHTRRRFRLLNLTSRLQVADAEYLPFPDHCFDLVYSWGVLMCTPDTGKAIREVYRVLKPGGVAKVMLYHKYSMVGLMLWLRYALLSGRPFTPLLQIYMNYLESPGTKAYSVEEAKNLFKEFDIRAIDTFLTHGDLLTSKAGQRHQGPLLRLARRIWPRSLIRLLIPKNGLFMTIEAVKKR
jgi:ubiquinone/menaquinone biosynthesis C-methylase UbiE